MLRFGYNDLFCILSLTFGTIKIDYAYWVCM